MLAAEAWQGPAIPLPGTDPACLKQGPEPTASHACSELPRTSPRGGGSPGVRWRRLKGSAAALDDTERHA